MRKSAIALSLVLPLSGFAFFVDTQLNSASAQGAGEPQRGTIEQTIEGHYRYENGTRVSGLIVTDDGIVVVDGLSNEAMGQDERRLIAETFEQPVRYLVSSTFHNNYTRGNVAYGDVTKIGQELYKVDLQDMMDEDEREDIHEFFKETVEFSFDEARVEFSEDEFSDDEIRLLRIDFISKVAN